MDYPAAALREELQGVVRFGLDIDASGKVTDCTVTGSSGSDLLDAKTCELLLARARFNPGIDAAGKALAGTWASSVRWAIPPGNYDAPAPFDLGYKIVVEKDGSVSSCELLNPLIPAHLENMCDAAKRRSYRPITNSIGNPQRVEITVSQKVERKILQD